MSGWSMGITGGDLMSGRSRGDHWKGFNVRAITGDH